MKTMRINLWSSPRNISTALMYSFAQRGDTTVVDEPLYAHYLSKTNTEAEHPATNEIMRSQDQDGEKVVREVIFGGYTSEIVLFKQMTHHLIHLKLDFLKQTKNILLIRDPRAIIASYSKIVSRPAIGDIGVLQQYELFQLLDKNGKLAVIIDARELLLNPKKILRQLCSILSIPFDKNMLHWKAGSRPEDGIWSKYWYHNIHKSTGFKKYEKKPISLPPHLEKLAEESQPYYDSLYEHSLRHSNIH